MAYEYSDLVAAVNAWSQQAVKENWIDNELADGLVNEQENSAKGLFVDSHDRPLIVAFMGGTGVGKSSLLNKLAGQSIAKTGVERPTSREVTLYHHQSISLLQLQEKFPLQQIQIAQHADASNKHVIWVDMPDFDSTEEKNKDIVMQWLPFVDVLVYVVSPERYRDNRAWQLLLSQGASHAWMFVINQWDRGDSLQFDDFKHQLAKAGFDDPIIFKTISLEQSIEVDDELPQLKQAITSLATDKTITQLEARGLFQRKENLKKNLQQGLMELGEETVFSGLLQYQTNTWIETEKVLKKGFEWPITQASEAYSKTKISLKKDKLALWDDWAQSRFNDYIDDLILAADQKGLPSIPIRKSLIDIREKVAKNVDSHIELGCRDALIHPGNVIQRFFLKLAAICEILLPLMAMGIVGFQVFYGFYDSAMTGEEFLGVDFAVHSVLLILISWLLPFFVRKKMQPSLKKAALKGLNKGLDTAMASIELEVKNILDLLKSQHFQVTEQMKQLILHCDDSDELEDVVKSEQLKRMLVEGVKGE